MVCLEVVVVLLNSIIFLSGIIMVDLAWTSAVKVELYTATYNVFMKEAKSVERLYKTSCYICEPWTLKEKLKPWK